MRIFPPFHVSGILLPVLLMLATGCGGKSADSGKDQSGETEPSEAQVIEITVDDLPIGEYLPPLDDGRVELAEPKDWKRFARDNKYVARFYEEDPGALPRIIVSAEDSPYEGIADVDDSNHLDLLAAVVAEVSDKSSMYERPLLVHLGERYFVRYVLKAKLGVEGAERQILVTVLGGRKYEIDLQINARTIQSNKAKGYAVAASLRAAPPAAPGENPTVGDTEPATPEADATSPAASTTPAEAKQ
ncbi:MAG: hypothetical protein KDB14_27345 [Planctomycetales bacterium]|nr:hypothetical protein [Planctomycetales bacterium]